MPTRPKGQGLTFWEVLQVLRALIKLQDCCMGQATKCQVAAPA